MRPQKRGKTRRRLKTAKARAVLAPGTIPADDDAAMRLPSVLSVFPVSKTSWWRGVAAGIYPKPLKLSARIAGWRAGDIRELLARQRRGNQDSDAA